MKYLTPFVLMVVILPNLFALRVSAHEVTRSVAGDFAEVSEAASEEFSIYETSTQQNWNDMKKRVLRKWSDGALPEEKIDVEYGAGDLTRVKVDYDTGVVTAQTLVAREGTLEPAAALKINAEKQIEKALEKLVREKPSTQSVLSVDEITERKVSPQKLTRSLSEGARFGHFEKAADGETRSMFEVTFRLVPDHVAKRALRFKPLVTLWAQKYGLDPAFVLAIIRQESAFNPRARSRVGAIGLMQIHPPSAGREVFRQIKHLDQAPTDDYLYDPDQNIMMGTTYLSILRDQYFSDIQNKSKQRYFMICGYNWSAGRLRKLISKGSLTIDRSPAEIFQTLQHLVPLETQEYLRRVDQFTHEFRGDK